jgi:type IV pilus assembly protein PilY1
MKKISLMSLSAALLTSLIASSAWSFTPSQQPPATTAVPGNVMLALSVEFPTGLQVSYTAADYTVTQNYDGYFDRRKCYTYSTTNEVFNPASARNADGTCPVNTEWSGNFLNWLTMTNLDQFRSVLTGGTRDNFSSKSGSHAGDTTARTVLIRSFSDRNSYNPIKRIRTNSAGVPSAQRGSDKWVRSGGYGSKFVVSNANNFADWNETQQKATCTDSPLPGNNGTSWCFNIRVSACVTSAALGETGNVREANCQPKYSGVAKPEGLIQEYAGTLRFGAFGYLNQTGNDRSGAVLRSAMKSVGPVAATSTGVAANPNLEWNTTTGVMIANPDPTDATASGVSNSGLMNYLNKFGYAAGYKGNDPVSELYYAALRYMRGYALPTSYTNNLTDAYKDGFPVITGAVHERGGTRDPMINTCQKNFMLAIGDIYTHCDGNLPGSTNAGCTGGTPTDPDNLNVQNLWNTTRGMENMPDARDSTGVNGWAGGSGTPTPYIAGLAHWANTNDIRSDLTGEQNVSTYFVDVLENGNGVGGWPAAGTLRTQFWLAAKYGGFKKDADTGNNPNAKPSSWDANGDGVPDTWFAGSTPSLLKAGLSTAFANIASVAAEGSASSAAVTSSRQTSTSQVIYAGYNPKDWSGTVRACLPTQTARECSDTPTWEASEWLKSTSTATYVTATLTASTRKIFTSAGGSKMPFQWANMTTDQRNILNTTDNQGQNRLSYLRGDRSLESSIFRRRPASVLSDIVNAGVTYVAGSSPPLTGTKFPGHATYRANTSTRPPVVFVGGNDGMLHAFAGATGKELFGYIPGTVFSNLPSLSALNFQHKYFVDSTPMVGDFEKTGSTNAVPLWGTMLVGGLGAGGRGYYALDISGQSTFATDSETQLAANLPMWEFTSAQDADLGFTFNEPSIHPLTGAYRQIAKVADTSAADGVWRVVVGNGFGSSNGKAVLFMLNANTGAVVTKLEAYAPTTANPAHSGLAAPTPVDTDRDGLIDTVYAGDALGNMYKFQFSKVSGSDFVLAKSGDANGAWRFLGKVYASGEPITTAPSVARSCDGLGWSVAFGTGKLNEDTDYSDTASRSFFAIVDKSPSSALTVASTALATITYTTATVTSTTGVDVIGRNWSTPNLNGKKGWKMTFANGERVLGNSTLPPDTGTVVFGTTQPAGNVCTPSNSGFVMAVGLCSGASGGINVNGVVVGGFGLNSTGVVKISNTFANDKNLQTVVCNQDGCKPPPEQDPDCITNPTLPKCTKRGATIPGEAAPRGRYSWREILSK